MLPTRIGAQAIGRERDRQGERGKLKCRGGTGGGEWEEESEEECGEGREG